ncbi:hypothetical protein A946_02360 [Methylacidiphilum kamchatkense Kam1]|uniref:Uncharacterized protein n=1 Tax=Methylacidiphilum kamchatkense Kam1 TaxID=1202785 RepID=A0ABR4ZY23_9BACT|nr:hypothetical protein A946_02360 [Methylacidiphilum kamchatkense Kam1]
MHHAYNLTLIDLPILNLCALPASMWLCFWIFIKKEFLETSFPRNYFSFEQKNSHFYPKKTEL